MVEEYYNIKIKPVAEGWQMGEVWDIKLHRDTTMRGVMAYIEEHRGIPQYRQYFRLANGKGLPLARESWSLRRLGIGEGYTIQVEPTMHRSWWWHSLQFYEKKLCDQIRDMIKKSKPMTVEHLMSEIDIPPPITTSLKVFLRKYPEVFLLVHDVTQDKVWVQLPNYRYQLPIYTMYPLQMGYAPTITTPDEAGYDFEARLDIDTDLKRVEVDFEVPDVVYEVAIMGCNDLMLLAERSHANYAFVCVYFMEKLIGKTYVKINTRNPVWRDQIFNFAISASVEVFSCSLRFEVWDSDGKIMDDGSWPYTQFLGGYELTGQSLIDLICNRKQTINVLPLQMRVKSLLLNDILKFQYQTKQTTVDYEKISGTITVKGGKRGMECNVLLAYNLIELPDPRSKPMAVCCWNGEDLGQSFPDRLNVMNPVFEEVFRIPRLGLNKTLKEALLEVQIWGTDPENEEIKGDFMGSVQIKDQKLVELMEGNHPYASRFKKELTQSKNIPFKHRKKPVRGGVSIQLGPSGLHYGKSTMLEIEFVAAIKIAKFSFVYYTVDWNFRRIFKSGPITVISTKIGEKQSTQRAPINEKFRCELDYGAVDAHDCNFQIHLHEYNKLAGAEAEYLGMIQLTGESLCNLVSRPYRKEAEFDLENHPFIDIKLQRMIRGQVMLKGGKLGLRAKNERILMIESCHDLVDLHAKKDIPTLTCPVVVVFWNGKEIGKTKYMFNHTFINSPLWEEQIFFVELPVYVPPIVDVDGDAGDGGGFFGNLFKMLKKKNSAPVDSKAISTSDAKAGGGAVEGEKKESVPDTVTEGADAKATEKDDTSSVIEGSQIGSVAEGSQVGSVAEGSQIAKSEDKSEVAKSISTIKSDNKSVNTKDQLKKGGKEVEESDTDVEYTLANCYLDIEVWDYTLNVETNEYSQHLFLGGFRVNNEALEDLMGQKEPQTRTFDLQTNTFKYPRGKVNLAAKCTISSCGASKYDTPYEYWEDLQKVHIEQAAVNAEAKRKAIEYEAEMVRLEKERAWKLLHPDPDPVPDVVAASSEGGGKDADGNSSVNIEESGEVLEIDKEGNDKLIDGGIPEAFNDSANNSSGGEAGTGTINDRGGNGDVSEVADGDENDNAGEEDN